MKKRCAALVCLLVLTGCSMVFPNTSAAIAPASLDELGLGVAADVEMWVKSILMLLGLGG